MVKQTAIGVILVADHNRESVFMAGATEQDTPKVALPSQQTEYVTPGPVTARGLAPGMTSKLIRDNSERTYAVIFGKGDEVASGLTEFAENNGLKACHLTAIGAFRSAVLGYFDLEKRAYRKIVIDQQVEVLSFIGEIALDHDKPSLHAHVVLGFPDGTTRGGHLLEARVWPTLEVFAVDSADRLIKRYDPESGLDLIDPSL
jgi:predicted DNA-binding protein with PD1-like motif